MPSTDNSTSYQQQSKTLQNEKFELQQVDLFWKEFFYTSINI